MVDELLRIPDCMKGSFSEQHFAQYATNEKLLSSDSLESLKALAVVQEVDIAQRECGHASTRRVATVRSTQTHVVAL